MPVNKICSFNFINAVICVITLLVLDNYVASSSAKFVNNFGPIKIECLKKHIQVELAFATEDVKSADTLYSICSNPLKSWQQFLNASEHLIKIPLRDAHTNCGFTRVINKIQRRITYHRKLEVGPHINKKSICILCAYKVTNMEDVYDQHKIVRRSALPDDFQEDQDIEVIDTITQSAPEPDVAIEVRQNDQLINDTVTVIPGTPLVMDVRLNDAAADIYGLNVNYLEVSDGGDNKETILFRGCTVDPYLFENFLTSPNNTLQAKFRAFKFPNTSFVQFRANIRICLKKCQVAHCLTGLGRSRREINSDYDISTAIFLRVEGFNADYKEDIRKTEDHFRLLKIKNLNLEKAL